MRQLALPRSFYRAGRLQAAQATPIAEARAHLLDTWHRFRKVGLSGRAAAAEVQVPYATLCRWDNAVRTAGLPALNDGSRRPHHSHKAQRDPQLVAAVKALRERFPRWGKDRLTPLLQREGWSVTSATVGRILAELKRTGQLREPHGIRTKPRVAVRPHAIRKPKDYQAVEPGHIVQIDTVDLRPLPGVILKQFTAIDVVSRWSVLGLRTRATSGTAAQFLLEVLARMPFTVRAIQVDGGSEFKDLFEAACKALGIPLFVLPPRSPKLNGCVERANRSHREEFWQCYDGDLDLRSAQAAQRQWETLSNTYRPHQGLGWITPLQYLEACTSAVIPT